MLHNKLPQLSTALNNTRLLSLNFCGSGSGHSLAGCPRFRVFHKAECVPWGSVISRFSWMVGFHLELHAHQGLYCQRKYQLSATWVSRVLLTAWQLASSKVRALGHKESKCSRWKSQPFCNLILGVALHHFCVLFIKARQSVQGKGLHKAQI